MNKKKNKKLKNVILILIILIIALIAVIMLLKTNPEKPMVQVSSEISSIEELLKFYDCKNISIHNSSEDSFEKDIYLEFGEGLWKGEESNERYFGSIISNLTVILEYDSFRMIDSSRELVIAVICDKENNSTRAIYINGQINYFQQEIAKKVAKKEFKRLDTIELTINSTEIKKLMDANWNPRNIDFGQLESRFEDYDIYFDEGLEIKTIGGKVYNIIFTEKYTDSIINGLKVNSSKQEIVKTLGNPLFEQDEIYGYKGEKIYVFFSGNEVSVYRVEDDYNQQEFLEVWNNFNETKNAKKFINEVTDVWPDFDIYLSESNFVTLQYTLKGIKIEFNTGGENGLILYNNFNGELQEGLTLEKITEENLPKYVFLNTDLDLVFIEEQKRSFNKQQLYSDDYIAMMEYDSNMQEDNTNEESENKYSYTNTKSNEFNMIFSYVLEDEIYGIKFVSKTREYPNSELIRHKLIYRYGWIDDEQFVYSVKNTGIYLYNAKTRNLETLVEGNDEFNIKEIKNNVVIYDDGNRITL